MRVALCQITSVRDPGVNLEQVRQGVAQAAGKGASIVLFPEATMAGFGASLVSVSEPLDGPWASGVRQVADAHGVLVVTGMFTPASSDRVFNTLLVTGRGYHLGYHKIHLFDAFGFRESQTVVAGNEMRTVVAEGIGIGLTTCYDVRFPELFQALADRGAAVILLGASWGDGDSKREQWELLVRARALDSTCWLLACGQADPRASSITTDPKAPTGIGYSTVVDPTGRIHAQLGSAPDMLVVDVDSELVESTRQAIPVLANRRLPLKRE
ncbi:MAG: carbon-nitrogen hydrolase family protein [Candidatus Dormibacteraceae bacterium]